MKSPDMSPDEQLSYLRQEVYRTNPDLVNDVRYNPKFSSLFELATIAREASFVTYKSLYSHAGLREMIPEQLKPLKEAGWEVAGNSPTAAHITGLPTELHGFTIPGAPTPSLYDLAKGQYLGNEGPHTHVSTPSQSWIGRLLGQTGLIREAVHASKVPDVLPQLGTPENAQQIIEALGRLTTNSEAAISDVPADLLARQAEQGIIHAIPPKLILVRQKGAFRKDATRVFWQPSQS